MFKTREQITNIGTIICSGKNKVKNGIATSENPNPVMPCTNAEINIIAMK
jgi:hypothetical protein